MSELLNLAWADFLAFILVFLRVGLVFAAIPFFGAEIVPRRITAVLALFLSLVLLPVVPPVSISPSDLTVFGLVGLILHDLLIGMCLGLSISVIFAGVQLAGQLMGFQMGFAIANVVDPMTGEDAPITSNLLYITAFLLFLCFEGHHLLIQALTESFVLIPVAENLAQKGFLLTVLTYGGQMFLIGMKVAAPAIGVLLLMNVSFALVARAVPQMNVFLMSFPLTIMVGLTFMVIVIKLLPYFLNQALGRAGEFMQAAMALF